MSTPLPLLGLLLLWGTIVGLDVVTVPQSMVSRPLVAGTIAGFLITLLQPGMYLVSPLLTGMMVGATLELYALDVLPVGASRYPDYGPATVAAVYAALAWPRPEVGLGASVAVGLLIAVLGGWAMQFVRRANAAAIQRRAAALSAGESDAIRALQWGGIRRDIARSAGVTLAGLMLAELIWPLLPPGSENFRWITVVAVGGGIAAAVGGAIRSTGRTRRVAWLIGGLCLGILVVGLR
jgi:mannose/fructose/N-acetylgalactosamine-specific phosphotransferase system component IIC